MNNTTLEVHVKDRISVIPDHFEFYLSIKKYAGDDEVSQQEQKVIDQIVSKYGKLSAEQKQTDRYGQDMYVLNLDGASEVKDLSAEVAKLKIIQINWFSRTSSKEEDTESMLTEKLLHKAKKRGEYLSKLLERSLGEMIAVVDNPMKDIRKDKWVVYPPMSAISQWLPDFSKQDIIFEKEMVVKFQLKD